MLKILLIVYMIGMVATGVLTAMCGVMSRGIDMFKHEYHMTDKMSLFTTCIGLLILTCVWPLSWIFGDAISKSR